jgi:hypothetical protein
VSDHLLSPLYKRKQSKTKELFQRQPTVKLATIEAMLFSKHLNTFCTTGWGAGQGRTGHMHTHTFYLLRKDKGNMKKPLSIPLSD